MQLLHVKCLSLMQFYVAMFFVSQGKRVFTLPITTYCKDRLATQERGLIMIGPPLV